MQTILSIADYAFFVAIFIQFVQIQTRLFSLSGQKGVSCSIHFCYTFILQIPLRIETCCWYILFRTTKEYKSQK